MNHTKLMGVNSMLKHIRSNNATDKDTTQSNTGRPESKMKRMMNRVHSAPGLFLSARTKKPVARLYFQCYAETVDKIVEYFEEEYKLQRTDLKPEEKHSNRKFLVCTPLHSALVSGDTALIDDVMNKISDRETKEFAVNALVTYQKESSFNCGDIFRARIAHLPEKHKKTFLEFEADVKKQNKKYNHPYPHLHLEMPLALAVLSGDISIVKNILSLGADLYGCDSNGNNIIHNLVYISLDYPQMAINMFREIADMLVGSENKQRLGMKRNKDGLKPMDLAARVGAISMFQAIITWNDVYRFPVKECGPFSHVLYDVTDYELGNDMHILQYLAFCPERHLSKIYDCQLLETEPIKTWIHVFSKMFHLQARLWAVTWAIFLLLFFMNGAYYFASGGEHPPKWLTYILLFSSSLEIASEIYGYIRDRKIFKLKRELAKKVGPPIAFTPVYRIFQGLFSLSLIITEVLLLSNLGCSDYHTIFTIFNVINIVLAFCSMLIFIQLNKATGHLLIIMESMVAQATLFLSVGGVIFCIFPLTLHILHVTPDCLTSNGNDTVLEEEVFMFTSLTKSFYETFLLGLGILVPNPLYFENSLLPIMSRLVYVTLVFVVGIVMINLLIAVMTDRVAELNTHKDTIQKIQRISISLLLNRSRNTTLVNFLNPFKYCQEEIRGKHFVQSNDKSQVFLHVIEPLPLKRSTFEY